MGCSGWIRPVDIAIGDGKNVSVNVTALSVPFSPVKGHHHRLPDTLETASSAGHRHDIKLQYASTHTHRATAFYSHFQISPERKNKGERGRRYKLK